MLRPSWRHVCRVLLNNIIMKAKNNNSQKHQQTRQHQQDNLFNNNQRHQPTNKSHWAFLTLTKIFHLPFYTNNLMSCLIILLVKNKSNKKLKLEGNRPTVTSQTKWSVYSVFVNDLILFEKMFQQWLKWIRTNFWP